MRVLPLVVLSVSSAALGQPDPGAALPSVVAINLCADQLVLSVADESQIRSLSWLASDPQESMLATAAARYPANYGTAEEVLKFDPDVVVAGSFTNEFTRALLRRLGYRVLDLPPASRLSDVEDNLHLLGDTIGRTDRANEIVAALRSEIARIEALRPAEPVPALLVRPGGYTTGPRSLPHAIMELVGLRNVAAERQLDSWGSLSMETLLRALPALLVITDYRSGESSLANAVLEHRALNVARGELPTVEVPARYWACGTPETLGSAEILLSAVSSAAAQRLVAARYPGSEP